MKRILIKLIVFLLLGAIVNVTVAWGAKVFDPPPGFLHWIFEEREPLPDAAVLLNRYLSGPAIDRLPCSGSVVHDGWGWREANVGIIFEERTLVWLNIHEAGWPLAALHGRMEVVYQDVQMIAMIDPSSWGLEPILGDDYLPCAPLWPGFAINTLFYAAILWLMFAATFALRRKRRLRRGLCPECAYPIGASAVCTECGGAVRSRTGEATS